MSEQRCVEPPMNQNRGEGNMPPSKHTPDEIRNSMFLHQLKIAFMGGIGVPEKFISSPQLKKKYAYDKKNPVHG